MSRTRVKKKKNLCFFKKATLSLEHGLCPPLGFEPPCLLNIAGRKPATFHQKGRGLGVFRVVHGVSGVSGVQGVHVFGCLGMCFCVLMVLSVGSSELVVGFNYGFGLKKKRPEM